MHVILHANDDVANRSRVEHSLNQEIVKSIGDQAHELGIFELEETRLGNYYLTRDIFETLKSLGTHRFMYI